MSDVVEENPAFQEKRCILLLRLPNTAGQAERRRGRLLLEYRVTFADFPAAIRGRHDGLFATKDDLLE